MLPLGRTPVWSNWSRRRFLSRLRLDLEFYFEALTYEAFPFRAVESDEARRVRSALEGRLRRGRRIVRSSGRVSSVRLAPGKRTGDVRRVDLLSATFELDRYSLRREDVLEVLDAALRAYEGDAAAAWIRTLNPLYWLDMGLDAVERAPFALLRFAGVAPAAIANSVPGRIFRLLLRAAALATLVVAIVVAAGWHRSLLLAGERLLDRIPWLAHTLKIR